MTIRNRLTYQFTVLVASLLLLFSVAVYYFSSHYRANEFYLRLRNRAITTAQLLIDTKGVNHDLLKTIDKNTVNALYNSKIVIYNYQDKEIYNSTESEHTEIPVELLNKIRREGEVRYREGKKEVIGIRYNNNNNYFVVIASAFDQYGLNGLNNLNLILILGLIAAIVVIIFLGFFFSDQALAPIADVVEQVENITVNNLNRRVNAGNGTDEIAQLAIKFNKMLENLETAFHLQRSFVSNASHELRTPLTFIGGQIEVALMNKRDAAEYERVLHAVWEDIKNLNKLSNGLLDLAQADMNVSGIQFKDIRMDEMIMTSRAELIARHKDYVINIEYTEVPDDENKMTAWGNEHLLKTAVLNVMDNACKYSRDKKVTVKIRFDEQAILLEFADKGIGISSDDLAHVFESFYRANNVRSIEGHGIGLALTEKIITLHKGRIRLSSVPNEGTSVFISIPQKQS